jgi:hypothetical protein
MVSTVVGSRHPLGWKARLIGAVLLADAVTFFVFALLHAGVHLAGLSDTSILAATIVESICGVLTAGAGVAVLTRRPWAWRAAVWAQSFTTVGVLLGILSQLRGTGPTPLNFVYHRVILTVVLAGLVFVAVPSVRKSL